MTLATIKIWNSVEGKLFEIRENGKSFIFPFHERSIVWMYHYRDSISHLKKEGLNKLKKEIHKPYYFFLPIYKMESPFMNKIIAYIRVSTETLITKKTRTYIRKKSLTRLLKLQFLPVKQKTTACR